MGSVAFFFFFGATVFAQRRHPNPAGDGKSVCRQEILAPQIRGCQINADGRQ